MIKKSTKKTVYIFFRFFGLSPMAIKVNLDFNFQSIKDIKL